MSVWIRTRVLPWVVWATSAASAAYLWHDMRATGSAVGFAQGAAYSVAPPQIGRISAVQVAPGQQVRAGQVIARVDAIELDAERAILAAERGRLEAQLAATRADGALTIGDRTRPFDESVEDSELALRTARAERDVRAAELKALNRQIDALGKLVKERMTDRRELDALGVTRAALKQQVEASEAVIEQLMRRVEAARGRRAALPDDVGELQLAPVRAELAVLAAREQRLAASREQTVLRAPVDGQVASVHVRAGEVAEAGAPVVTIVADAPAESVEVSVCVPEAQAGRVQLGEAVRLRPRGVDGPQVAGHVTRLGPQIAELPVRCRRNPQIAEYGREVAVALDEPAPLLPGQAFTVAFLGYPSPCVTEVAEVPTDEPPDPAATTAPAAPRSIEVPQQLAARTRFEPSALTWLPGRSRFVIASDDTGHPSRDEHAPWLFTMDERGRVDPEPLVVAGIDGFNDVEAVAPGPRDSLYVLASQSYSRRGRRPAARQVFARVAIGGEQAKVVASVSLAEQLDRAGARALRALGIRDTAELDLEGMTPTASGGLLIGLKAPLDAQGRAMIWHLPRPDVLFAGGGVVAAGLSRWGAVPLKVTADGVERAGGVSELLELPDGSLLIAATATGSEPKRQDGGLWHAAGREALASARQIRSFPGLKPEGLALRADRSQLVIVFDTGAETPKRMELPWPVNN